jgi:hypothetical protein
MLWYKAWLETRSRFILALVGCTALCSMWIVEFGKQIESFRGVAGLFNLFHMIHGVLAFVWILSVILLMMSGLLQEQAVGTSSFTLALPVSRSRLMLVRIGMGLVQAFVLTVVPWLGMLVVSGLAGKTYPVSQVSLHVFFLLSGGAVFLALALLISSVVEGQYTAPIVSIGISVLLINALKAEKLNPYSPWTFMMGSEYFQFRTGLFSGQIPLLYAAAFCAAQCFCCSFRLR